MSCRPATLETELLVRGQSQAYLEVRLNEDATDGWVLGERTQQPEPDQAPNLREERENRKPKDVKRDGDSTVERAPEFKAKYGPSSRF